tara:strand:- start:489 stop:1097 length:609 start_codon:yes stop_codon:yes gene_type:complete
MNRNDIKTLLCLNRFLPNDLSRIIVKYKRDTEYKETVNEYKELGFHNWLDHDITIRSELGNIMINYVKMENEIDKMNYIQEKIHESYLNGISYYDYYLYYEKYKQILHLNPYYVRNKPMSICFLSKWYQTTEKNSLPWKRIHDLINIMDRIKIYSDLNDIMYVVKTPSFMEKIILMNKIGMTWHYEFIYYNEYLFDSNYHTI